MHIDKTAVTVFGGIKFTLELVFDIQVTVHRDKFL